MFYLTTHSTHFIYGYMASDIWLRTILIVKGNPLPPHRLLFLISSKGSFICTIQHRIAHTTAFVTPVVEHWLEREILLTSCNYSVSVLACGPQPPELLGQAMHTPFRVSPFIVAFLAHLKTNKNK